MNLKVLRQKIQEVAERHHENVMLTTREKQMIQSAVLEVLPLLDAYEHDVKAISNSLKYGCDLKCPLAENLEKELLGGETES